ncbi:hypothetical protein LC087_12060 [Bacillus carboniphilus]|uniref:Uncharacterized protein n=1 Tax=Bacillus carboniphilus TaxID=86663 RepID=A0ABY9JT70_9BACI|nr:hypothetical protein [Bacillus carboniphilus]WLR41612.1 hypothetical protein LC087_12060 [Bacillus carboniphilus]
MIFLMSLLVYASEFFTDEDLFPGPLLMFSVTILPVIGLVASLKSKGIIKVIGIIGNSFILVWAVILPTIVTTFFWNQP